MRSSFVLSTLAFPFFAVASPEPEAYASPVAEPQFPALIPLIGGAFLLGALENYAKGAAANERCSCPNAVQRCEGTTCECANQAAISCWVSRAGKCAVQISNCPGPNGRGTGLPTNPSGEFPPCGGKSLAQCAAPRQCKKLDASCRDNFGQGSCLGICIPEPRGGASPALPKQSQQAKQGGGYFGGAQQSPQSQAQPKPAGGSGWQSVGQQNRPPPKSNNTPSGGTCPAGMACPTNFVCVPEPRSEGAFMCLQPSTICGGFRNDPCPSTQFCVRDPRLNCQGQGCTGVCA